MLFTTMGNPKVIIAYVHFGSYKHSGNAYAEKALGTIQPIFNVLMNKGESWPNMTSKVAWNHNNAIN